MLPQYEVLWSQLGPLVSRLPFLLHQCGVQWSILDVDEVGDNQPVVFESNSLKTWNLSKVCTHGGWRNGWDLVGDDQCISLYLGIGIPRLGRVTEWVPWMDPKALLYLLPAN